MCLLLNVNKYAVLSPRPFFQDQDPVVQDQEKNTNNVISTAPFTPAVTNGALQLLVGLYHEYALLKR